MKVNGGVPNVGSIVACFSDNIGAKYRLNRPVKITNAEFKQCLSTASHWSRACLPGSSCDEVSWVGGHPVGVSKVLVSHVSSLERFVGCVDRHHRQGLFICCGD